MPIKFRNILLSQFRALYNISYIYHNTITMKLIIKILPLLLLFLTNSCFIIYSEFVYGSDVDERREEMNNRILVDTFTPLTTGGTYSFIVLSDTHIDGGNPNGLERLPGLLIIIIKIIILKLNLR